MIYNANTQWPPTPAIIQNSLQEWDAWYSGDPTTLDAAYSDAGPRVRHSDGLFARASRRFWGQPQGVSNARTKLHMPIAQDIAAASSDLLFGQELLLEWENEAAEERMAEVLDGNNFYAQLAEAGEVAAALGGVYLRVGWDSDVAGHALMTVVHADGAIPRFRYGRLQDVTLWEIVRSEDGVIWRHLEVHTPGRISHFLHRGSASHLGGVVSLLEADATSNLEAEIATGLPGLAVVYIPNLRPTPHWRSVPEGRYLGRSDFGIRGVTQFMDALDETWTSWMRDLRLGKARIMVSSLMLDNSGPGRGSMLDLDREVYEAFNFAQPEGATLSDMVSSQQFQIRTAEHAQTVDALLGVVVRSCGYSGSTFGLGGAEAAKTATEVNSIDRRSASTREKKTRYWGAGLREYLTILSAVDAIQFGGTASPVRVSFPPDAQPSMLDTAQAVQAFRAAQAMSIETGVRLAQPDLDEEGVRAEVQRIQDETAAANPPAIDAFGMAGTGDEFDTPTPPEEQA